MEGLGICFLGKFLSTPKNSMPVSYGYGHTDIATNDH